MFGALKRGFRSMAGLILVRNVFGELRPKRTLAASRGFLAAARLSCYKYNELDSSWDIYNLLSQYTGPESLIMPTAVFCQYIPVLILRMRLLQVASCNLPRQRNETRLLDGSSNRGAGQQRSMETAQNSLRA